MNLIYLLLVLGSALLVTNSYVNALLIRGSSYTLEQKIYQTLIIWIIPVLGVLMVWVVMRSDVPEKQRSQDFKHDMDDMAYVPPHPPYTSD